METTVRPTLFGSLMRPSCSCERRSSRSRLKSRLLNKKTHLDFLLRQANKQINSFKWLPGEILKERWTQSDLALIQGFEHGGAYDLGSTLIGEVQHSVLNTQSTYTVFPRLLWQATKDWPSSAIHHRPYYGYHRPLRLLWSAADWLGDFIAPLVCISG